MKARKLPSGNWCARAYSHTDDAGKKIYVPFTAPTKAEAEYLANEFKYKKKRLLQGKDITVEEAITAFINDRSNVLSPSTIAGYRTIQRNHFPDLMKLKVSDLKQDRVQKAVNKYARDLSVKTMKNAIGLITSAVKQYIPDASYPVKYPQKRQHEITIPTEEEVRSLLAETKGTALGVAILLAVTTGMRRGEICALQRSDIRGGMVHVNKSMVMDGNGDYTIKPPKTEAGNRSIPIPDHVVNAIIELDAPNGSAVGLNLKMLTGRWNRHQKKYGYSFRFHDFRHFYASKLLAMGMPDKYIMRNTGHATLSMLKDRYQHVMQEKMDEFNRQAVTYFVTYLG